MSGQNKRLLSWSIIHALVLLSLLLPPISLLTVWLLMAPLAVLFVRLPLKSFIIRYGISAGAAFIIASLLFNSAAAGLLLIAISLFMLLPAVQMGMLYKKRASARAAVTGGAVTLLGQILLCLVISQAMGNPLLAEMKQVMLGNFGTIEAMYPNMDWSSIGGKEVLADAAISMIPLFLIGGIIVYALITHAIARKALVNAGLSIPGLKPIREWMVPKAFVWIYLIALLMEMFAAGREPGSFMFTLLNNLLPLIMIVFAVQGIAFLFYIAHVKQWNKLLPIGGIVLLVIFWPLCFLYSLLGVFDAAFPLRERLTSK